MFPIDNLREAVETAKRFLTKEKIDRQMTGQSSTPFIKLTEKKRKSLTFDARDMLEKTSENMERMMALMDKMYIKLEQKEVEDRIKNSLVKETIGEVIDLLVEIVMKVIEDMEEVEVIFREEIFRGNFPGRYNNRMDRSWENRRTWRQSRSRERERGGRSPSSSRSGSRTSTNRDRIRCFKCREYDHIVNECPNLIHEDLDKESNSARSVSLHLADSDTGSDMEQYLNT